MTVDSGALVEPTLFEGGVRAHHDHIRAAVIEVVGHVVMEAAVAAGLGPEIETVHPHLRVAVDAVEGDADAAAEIFGGNREALAIPSDAVLRKVAADGLRTVIAVAASIEGQLDGPVVRQVDDAPGPVVELGRGRTIAVARLGEEERNRRKVEVHVLVGGIAKSKMPPGVHRDSLSDVCGARLRRLRLAQQGEGGESKECKHQFEGRTSVHSGDSGSYCLAIESILADRAPKRVAAAHQS